MVKITGPFPIWLFRLAPANLFFCGVATGANVHDRVANWVLAPWALWFAVPLALVSVWFLNGAVGEMESRAALEEKRDEIPK